jgi:hypothetical protein
MSFIFTKFDQFQFSVFFNPILLSYLMYIAEWQLVGDNYLEREKIKDRIRESLFEIITKCISENQKNLK